MVEGRGFRPARAAISPHPRPQKDPGLQARSPDRARIRFGATARHGSANSPRSRRPTKGTTEPRLGRLPALQTRRPETPSVVAITRGLREEPVMLAGRWGYNSAG